ncbi:MAG: hypothetical protein NC336_07915 [Clostridium sp.]|nr:hypothetical protein [Clostridium sp.]
MNKNILFLPLALVALSVATSCSDNDTAEPAKAAISVDQTELEVNQSMTIHFVGQADNVVIYPGDESHVYELRDSSNSGLVVNKGLFTYSYSLPGIYKVVCVATNHEDMGRSLSRDTCSVYIHVTDDITAIDKLSAPAVLYDEVYATAVNDRDWVLPIPRKIHYKTSDATVNLKKQKLKFYIESQSTTVGLRILGSEADFNPFVSTKQYDLTSPWEIRTTSSMGSTRDYRLYTLNYGEFKTFKAAGVTAKIVRTEYDYTYYSIDLEVPAGTDLATIAPVFTLYDTNEHVYLPDGSEAVSGQPVDFTSPVTYRFVVTSPENPEVKVESTCVVTIKTK